MLKRLYIDNYKCFVNFTFEPQQLQLVLGLNGTGKSAFLEALRSIREFASGGVKSEDAFPRLTHTRWQARTAQRFELRVDLEQQSYEYTLTIDDAGEPPSPVVLAETLSCNESPLVNFANGEVQLFGDDHSELVRYPFDWHRSVLATISSRSELRGVEVFKGWLANLYCLKMNLFSIQTTAENEQRLLFDDASNFASWYRHLSQERTPREMSQLQSEIANVISGFESLELPSAGPTSRFLQASFAGDAGKPARYMFHELSDGQRAVVVLYTLLEFLVISGHTVCIDEPDNYLALSEIQPWLFEVVDRLEAWGGQVILISHHPELINMFANDRGTVFVRDASGPVRTEPFSPLAHLSPSEQVARGWDRG